MLAEANKKVLELAERRGDYRIQGSRSRGISCATSEMAHAGGFGVTIHLDVSTSRRSLSSSRGLLLGDSGAVRPAVPEEMVDDVLRIYNEDFELPHIYHGAGAVVIGDVPGEVYRIESGGSVVCEAPVDVITTGISYDRGKKTRRGRFEEPELDSSRSLREDFISVISSPNIASKNYVFKRYDSEVQGRAVLRPGEADAGVIAPIEGREVGLAFSVDGNPFYGMIDPYQGGALAVCEAARNVASVGSVPSTITDCLNYGNPEIEEVFWEFSEGVRGIGDACRGIGLVSHEGNPLPVVSGNVSFYNQGESGKAIPPSPIIACVGVAEDYSRCRSIRWKEEGDVVYYIGEPLDELGGSEYYRVIYKTLGANVPEADFIREKNQIKTVIEMHSLGWVRACHDVSQGGLLTALAEMAIGGRGSGHLGLKVDLEELAETGLEPEKMLFSETGGFVVELPDGIEREVLALCTRNRVKLYKLGALTGRSKLEVLLKGERLAIWPLDELRDAFMGGCRGIFGIEKET